MNITDEQAAANSPKVKAMRTSVGWFSSPACAVIYQTCKYTALFSSKGYAVGSKFAKWFAAEEATTEGAGAEPELKGCIEDLLAVCGSRDYVFFMYAAVTERLSQEGSLKTYTWRKRPNWVEKLAGSFATPSSPASTQRRSCRPCVPWR